MGLDMPGFPDGITTSTDGTTVIAVKNGQLVAEGDAPGDITIYDWTESDLLDQFTARLRKLNPAASEGT